MKKKKINIYLSISQEIKQLKLDSYLKKNLPINILND